MASRTSAHFVEMRNDDMRIDIDVAIRAWNPGRAEPTGRTLPFEPIVLHQIIKERLREVAKKQGWRLSRGILETSGGAFRTKAWYRGTLSAATFNLP